MVFSFRDKQDKWLPIMVIITMLLCEQGAFIYQFTDHHKNPDTRSVHQRLYTVGQPKLGGLRAERCGGLSLYREKRLEYRPHHLLQEMSSEFRETPEKGFGGDQQHFPSVSILTAGEQQEEDGSLLSVRTPQQTDLENTSKKVLYTVNVKVTYQKSLGGVELVGLDGARLFSISKCLTSRF